MLALVLLSLFGCGEDGPARRAALDAGADAGDAAPDAGLPDPICHAGTRWSAGTPIFREVTDDWGLEGIVGYRVSVTDVDRDGWPDLLVRGFGVTKLVHNAHPGFEDVTDESGLVAPRPGGTDPRPGEVVASADVDGDGDLDILTATGATATDATELMLNDGAGVFTFGPEASEARGALSPAGVSFVDYDRDGLLDVFMAENSLGSPLQDRLYRGDGTGLFTDVTYDVGLTTEPWVDVDDLNAGLGHSWGWASAACDLNGDGWTEILASSYGRAPNLLFQGLPGGTFENRAVASGYAYDERMDWTDNESARCYCQLHPTAEDCAGVPPPENIRCTSDADVFRWDHTQDREPWRLGGNSGTTVCADVDDDGDIDLLTGEIVHWDVGSSSDPAELLVNTGEPDVRFERPGNDVTGLLRTHDRADWNDGIMTSAVFDFDDDGWPDVYWGDSDYPGSHGRLYHQESPGHFSEISFAYYFEHHRSHGVVAADLDRDGDLDLVVGNSLARCEGADGADCYPTAQVRVFENLLGADANFLQLHLEGAPGTNRSNRSAIGARVTVTADGLTQTQEVDGGHGHYGTQNDLVLHFGLAAACEAEVTVRWPDAALTTERFTLPAGYRFLLQQGARPVVDPR
jgi:hypothetical protein